jgi:integrase
MPARTPLTTFTIKNLKPRAERYEVPDSSKGLRLLVHPSGRKVWVLRFRRPGTSKNAKMTLGFWVEGKSQGEPEIGGPLTLECAHALGTKLLWVKATEKDPAAEWKAEKLRRRMAVNAPATGFGQAILDHVREYLMTRQRRWWEPASVLGVAAEKSKRRRSSAGVAQPDQPRLVLRPGGLAATWASRPLSGISPPEISAVVNEAAKKPLGGRRVSVKGESPSRSLALYMALSRFFRWCVETHRLERSPVTGKPPWKCASRDRVLSDTELRALWACCSDESVVSPWHGAALRLLLLLGQRREEISQLRWDELEPSSPLSNQSQEIRPNPGSGETAGSEKALDMVLPPARTKNRRMHTLPLPKMVLAILESVPRIVGSPYVFSADGVRPISNWGRAKKALDAAMAVRLRLGRGSEAIRLAPERLKPWRIHDLRRTMSTNLARIGVAIHINERCLNHVSGSLGGLVSVYQRYSYRSEVLEALEKWSAEVERIAMTPNKLSLPK